MKEYIVAYDGPPVEYQDGTPAEDFIIIGIEEAESREHALAKSVHEVSPMSTELAKVSKFRVFEIVREDRWPRVSYWSGDKVDFEAGDRVYHSEKGTGTIEDDVNGFDGLYVTWDEAERNDPRHQRVDTGNLETELIRI